MGHEAEDLLTLFDTLHEGDIWQYRYPEDNDLLRNGVRGIYLGNYIRWDPFEQHKFVAEKYGYRVLKSNRTFYPFDHPDCFIYMNLHDKLKFVKNGYSKVTDHFVREIRHGRLSKSNAYSVINHYQRSPIQHEEKFCEWLGITKSGLDHLVRAHSKKLNQTQANLASNKTLQDIDFECYSRYDLVVPAADNFITIGKGFPN
jgi:hypothetical protein